MRIIEQLVYKIQGDNSEFDRSIDKSETKVSKFGSVADKMLAGVTVAAIGMVVKKMGDMVISSANALDRVDKLSQKIGLSRVAFQEWDYILGQSDASVEGLQMGIKTLSNAADEARKGTALYAEAFDKLGVSVTDANGNMKDQEALFAEVFSALADMENQTERTALANKLLGRSATELAPALNTSKEEIEQLRSEAHSLGLVYSDELVDAGVALGDNIDRLKKSFGAFKTKALAPIIGVMVTVSDKMLGQYSASGTLEGALDKVKLATERYKNAQDEAKGKTDDLTEAMLAQARVELVQSIKALSDEWGKSSKEYDRTQKRINNLTTDIDVAKDVLSDFKDEWERKTGELFDVEMLGGDDLVEYKGLIDTIFDSQDELLNQQLKLGEAEKLRENLVQKLAEAYLDFGEDLTYLVERETDLHDAVVKRIGSVEKERKALAWATEEMKKYANASGEELDSKIKQVENSIKVLKGREAEADLIAFLNLLTKQRNGLLAIEAQKAEDASIADEKRQAIIDNANKAVLVSIEYSKALGDAFDLNAEKTSIYTGAIKALIDSGLDPADERIKELIDKMPTLADGVVEVTEEITKVITPLEKWNESLHDSAYLFGITGDKQAYYRSMIDSTQRALLEMRKEGIEPASEEYQKLTRMLDGFNEKLKESQKDANAWKSTTVEAISAVSSTFTALGSLMGATTEARLQELDAMLQAELKAQGVAEETEMESLQKRLAKAIETGDAELQAELEREIKRQGIREDFDEQKKRIQIEDAQRQKALAIFQAIIDTASAIIKAMPNPYLMGLAGATGAIQLATIQAQPLPSFDVGSIRVPETTQAIVHKDEMILTAPQAEQARREGITISPNGGGGGNYTFMIYLDGKEIARNTIDNLNSGSVGTIKARVVK